MPADRQAGSTHSGTAMKAAHDDPATRISRRCAAYNALHATDYTPETYGDARTLEPRLIAWDEGWEACERSINETHINTMTTTNSGMTPEEIIETGTWDDYRCENNRTERILRQLIEEKLTDATVSTDGFRVPGFGTVEPIGTANLWRTIQAVKAVEQVYTYAKKI